MPFESEAQRRKCWAMNDPAWDCHQWSHETPPGDLPEKVEPPTKKPSKSINLRGLDKRSRLVGNRITDIKRRRAEQEERLAVAANAAGDQARDEHGRWEHTEEGHLIGYHAQTKGEFEGGQPDVSKGSDYDVFGKGFYFGTHATASRYGEPVPFKIEGKLASQEQWMATLKRHARKKNGGDRKGAREELSGQGYVGIKSRDTGLVWDQDAVSPHSPTANAGPSSPSRQEVARVLAMCQMLEAQLSGRPSLFQDPSIRASLVGILRPLVQSGLVGNATPTHAHDFLADHRTLSWEERLRLSRAGMVGVVANAVGEEVRDDRGRWIHVFRGTGPGGVHQMRPSEEGVFGPGVYFYDTPHEAKTYAERDGGIIVGRVRPEHAQVNRVNDDAHGNQVHSVVVADPSDVEVLGVIPTDKTLSGRRALAREAEKITGMAHNVSFAAIDEAASRADPDPTVAQREAGVYRKGHVVIQGLPITIETAAGVPRKPGFTPNQHHYGYVNAHCLKDGCIQKSDSDGDHLDVFLGPDPESDMVWVVDQLKQDGSFDEHKCLVCFDSEDDATAAYFANYPPNWQGFGGVTGMSMDAFKAWLREGDTGRPMAGQDLSGLAVNAFCPGEGIKDNSCSSEKKVKEVWQTTKSQFMGPMGVDPAKEFGNFVPGLKENFIPVAETLRDIGNGYQVGVAKDDVSKIKWSERLGHPVRDPKPDMAVVVKDGNIVGLFSGDTLAVEPSHRGKGLTKELYRERMKLGPLSRGQGGGKYSQAGYAARASFHRSEVADALETGKQVPSSVLADYPDLASKHGMQVTNADGSPCRILELEDNRQPDHFSCGASMAMGIGQYFGVGPKNIDEWKTALGTTLEQSTQPSFIVEYLRELGLDAEERHGMTVDDLAECIQQGKPIGCPVQDYQGRREAGADYLYGHWLSVIGVIDGGGQRYIVCQDSSIENVERQPGGDVPKDEEDEKILNAPGRVMIREQDWVGAWRDIDKNGRKHIRCGIVVGPGKAGVDPLSSSGVGNAFCPGKGKKDNSCSSRGDRGGSTGDKFAAMPDGKASSKEAKMWIKSMQEEYDTDKNFRAVVDAVTVFTQGEYSVIRAYTEKAITGSLPDKYKDSSVPGWADKPIVGNPMTDTKTYFKGQSLSPDDEPSGGRTTYDDGGRALVDAIHGSPRSNASVYRGLTGPGVVGNLEKIQPGDDFDIKGVSSFTTDQEIGKQFSQGSAKGQGKSSASASHSVLMEVVAGARVLKVSSLSPWDQKEVLTQGKFRVRDVKTVTDSHGHVKRIHLVLEQTHVYRSGGDATENAGMLGESSTVKSAFVQDRPYPQEWMDESVFGNNAGGAALRQSVTRNAFCPGKGAQDNSCSSAGASHGNVDDPKELIGSYYTERMLMSATVQDEIPPGSKVIGKGANSVAILTPDGTVTRLQPFHGDRPIRPKVPGLLSPKRTKVVDTGNEKVLVETGLPRAERVPDEEHDAAITDLSARLSKRGWKLTDTGIGNFGKIKGRYVLLDPGAITTNAFCPGKGAEDNSCSSRAPISEEQVEGLRILHDAVDASDLDPEKATDCKASLADVVSRMPDAALRRMQRNLDGVRVHASPAEVTAQHREEFPGSDLQPHEEVAGYYSSVSKVLHLDGSGGGDPELGDAASLHAHEIMHAVDGPAGFLHRNPRWQDAWESEIRGGNLSRYARKSPMEGLAEMGRLMWGGSHASTTPEGFLEAVKKKYPLCHAFLRDQGLWPGSTPAVKGGKSTADLMGMLGGRKGRTTNSDEQERDAKGRWLAKIESMPTADPGLFKSYGREVINPFRRVPMKELKRVLDDLGAARKEGKIDLEEATLHPDDIANLLGAQKTLSAGRLKDIVDDPSHLDADDPIDRPSILEHGGNRYIRSGNHRLATAMLMNRPIKVVIHKRREQVDDVRNILSSGDSSGNLLPDVFSRPLVEEGFYSGDAALSRVENANCRDAGGKFAPCAGAGGVKPGMIPFVPGAYHQPFEPRVGPYVPRPSSEIPPPLPPEAGTPVAPPKGKGSKSKFIGATVDGKVHAAAERIKNEVAKALGGVPEEETEGKGQRDKKPYDVQVRIKGTTHDVECKSMTVGSKQSISVHEDALLRKVEHQALNPGNVFHTVVVDQRETHDGGANKGNFSGHRLYYKRGCGRFSLGNMHPVKDHKDLKRLLDMRDEDLPEKARGSLPPPPPVEALREKAAKASRSRKAKDSARKADPEVKGKLRQQARARTAAKKALKEVKGEEP